MQGRKRAKRHGLALPTPKGCPLTSLQWTALYLAAHGLRDKQMGEKMHLAPSSARGHVAQAVARLEAHNTPEAVAIASGAGWLERVDLAFYDQRPVTPAQALYLKRFDEFIHTGKQATRAMMLHHLQSIGWENRINRLKAHAPFTGRVPTRLVKKIMGRTVTVSQNHGLLRRQHGRLRPK